MNREELIQFLKDNLVISVLTNRHDGSYNNSSRVEVNVKLQLKINHENVIDLSESSDSFDLK